MTEALRRDPSFGPGVPDFDERMFVLHRALSGAAFTDELQRDVHYFAAWNTGDGVGRLVRLLNAVRKAEHELTMDYLLGGRGEYRPALTASRPQ